MRTFAALLLLVLCQSCALLEKAPPMVAQAGAGVGAVRTADFRWDGNVFVGHAQTEVNFLVYMRDTELPLFSYNVAAGKRLVVNRKMKFNQSYELSEPIPAWAGIVFRSEEKKVVGGVTGVPHLGIIFQPPQP